MTAALLALTLLAGPAAEASFVAPVEKAEVADVARELLRKRGCAAVTVEMLDPRGGRERLRAWCRDEGRRAARRAVSSFQEDPR